MYKVFFNEKQFNLINEYTDYDSGVHTLYIHDITEEAMQQAVDLLLVKNPIAKLVLHSDDLEDLWGKFKKLFRIVNAAGGVVKNSNSEVLFIYKRGKWDFPKGKVDEGEDFATTAVREVKEECGLVDLTLGEKIGETYHIYKENNENILKVTTWYAMESDHAAPFTVDEKEGIEKAAWVKIEEIPNILENSYPSIKEIYSRSIKS